jgi:uncharacterized protein
MVIWRIIDRRPGHDNQSRGLVNALCRLGNGSSHDIAADSLKFRILHYLMKRFPPGEHLSRPDFIIGAGHGTHLSVLSAQRACGGKSIIIMRPSLPIRWFDFCLIPDHDLPGPGDNIIITRGAINTVLPSTVHLDNLGLILVGGPSRHHRWDEQLVLNQIQTVLFRGRDIIWQISDSPRTPPATSKALENLGCTNVTYYSWQNTGHHWVENQLAQAGRVWVTADSVSMIYESLTAGARTGVLSVPEKKPGKLTRSMNKLITEGMVMPFPDWQKGKGLLPPPLVLDEALRCARLLLQHTGQLQHGA